MISSSFTLFEHAIKNLISDIGLHTQVKGS